MITDIDRVCVWCDEKFKFNTNQKNQIYCSRSCMYEWRKSTNWKTKICLNCKKEFSCRTKEKSNRTGIPRQYCSVDCSINSIEAKNRLRKAVEDHGNPFNNPKIQVKARQSKLDKYGKSTFGNPEKGRNTCLERYGVSTGLLVGPKSNGKRISNVQRMLYEQILKEYPDALLEKYLLDVDKSVDIYIPSIKKIVEMNGTYWHCDPRKYAADFYNTTIHMTAQEVWDKDTKRKKLFESFGYIVEVVWENDITKKFKF